MQAIHFRPAGSKNDWKKVESESGGVIRYLHIYSRRVI